MSLKFPLQGAEEQALALDMLSKEERGPLHGVPVSIKVRGVRTVVSDHHLCSAQECYDIAGTYSTAGMAYLARRQVTTSHTLPEVTSSTQVDTDCPAVQLVKRLGGIPFCKTNVPQVGFDTSWSKIRLIQDLKSSYFVLQSCIGRFPSYCPT